MLLGGFFRNYLDSFFNVSFIFLIHNQLSPNLYDTNAKSS